MGSTPITSTDKPIADDAIESVAIFDANNRAIQDGSAVLPIYSLTKTFIAATVIAAKINLSSPISRWFDSHWVPRGADINVAQLLSHQSGIRDYFSGSTAYSEAVARASQTKQQNNQPTKTWSDDTYADHTLRQPLWFEPGTSFGYSNPGYWLLVEILQKETDRSLAELINSYISRPLELESVSLAEGLFANDLPHYSAGWVWHGLLLASATDVARFMASPLIEPLRTHLVAVVGDQPGWQKPHYGYGLMVEPGERFGHNGDGPVFSAACYKFQKSGHTLCVLKRTRDLDSEPDAKEVDGAAMHRLLALHAQL